MKTYSKCPDAVAKRATSLIKKFHPDLGIVGLTIDFISVVNDIEGEPALMLNGYQCAAVVKIIGPKERAIGRADAEIVIDEESYLQMPDETKDALIDHELYHLEVVKNKHGKPRKDQYGRPKLAMRKHDHSYGWFNEIAQRHGSASLECQQSTRLFLAGKQLYFSFALKLKDNDAKKESVSLVN